MKFFAPFLFALMLALSMVGVASAAPPTQDEFPPNGNAQNYPNEQGVHVHAHCHQIDGLDNNNGGEDVYMQKYMPVAALNAGNAHGEDTALTECFSDEEIEQLAADGLIHHD